MSRFEKFATEQDLMERIEQLRREGFEESDITVISKQKLEDAYLKYRSVHFKNSEGTTWDKFLSMFSDDDPKDKVLGGFDITDSEKEHFKYALDRQEILLLKEDHMADEDKYVQNEPREYHETQQQDAQAMETEVAQNERLDARRTTTETGGRHSYEQDSAAERDNIEADNDITLKDTENDDEHHYRPVNDDDHIKKAADLAVKSEYDYNSKEYDYRK